MSVGVAPFGIDVTLVEPGYFRTDFLAKGSVVVAERKIDAYALVREAEAMHRDHYDGNQPGDPAKAARAVIEMAAAPEPPLHFLLGPDAYDVTEAKIAALHSDMEKWKAVTVGTAFG